MARLVKGTIKNDTLFGTDADEWMFGGSGDDGLYGFVGKDHLLGGAGNDTLSGGSDDDVLEGGGDQDLLNGGSGNDILTGGNHADTFAFDLVVRAYGGYERLAAIGHDVVTDFMVGVDTLQFDMAGDFDDLNFMQNGQDTVITFDGREGSVTLTGVDMETLLHYQQTDFVII